MEENRHRAWLENCFRQGTPPFPIAGAWGIRLDGFEPGGAAVSVDAGPSLHNPVGVVHGGVLFLLLDTAFGFAATSLLEGATRTGTVDVNVQFIRAAREGPLRAEARVIHRGRNVIHLEGDVRDASGVLVARGHGTALVTPDPSPPANPDAVGPD